MHLPPVLRAPRTPAPVLGRSARSFAVALGSGLACQRGFSSPPAEPAAVREAPAAPVAAPPPPAPQSAATGAEAAFGGQLVLAPALQHAAAAGDTVFVMARAADDRRMLAVTRLVLADPPRWPLVFQLADARLQAGTRACLSARIDKDGDATTKGAGDVVGEAAQPFTAPNGDVVLTLDRPL